MSTRDELLRKAARRRAHLFVTRHPVFAEPSTGVRVRNAPSGEGEIDAYGEPGETSGAREHFHITEQPTEEYGLLIWTRHMGRTDHGLVLRFVEPVGRQGIS